MVASKDKQKDVWSKVIHIWKNTSSNIVSKSISKNWGINTYRGLIQVLPWAKNVVNSTRCDALLLDDVSVSDSIPTIEVKTNDATVSHEATAGKIDENQLFYLMSRWLTEEKSMIMIVNWFVSSVTKELPLEYAWELNHLIELEVDNSVG